MGKKESQVKVRIFHGSFSIVLAKTIKRFLTLGCVPYRSSTQKILFSLIFIMSQGISIHAMDNVRIMPFNYEQHFDVAFGLLSQDLNERYVSTTLHSAAHIEVLVKPYPRTRSHRPDQILGVIAYNRFLAKHSKATTWIKALGITKRYRHRGYGTKLMQHIESMPCTNDHEILLRTTHKTSRFYLNLGYEKEFEYDEQGDECDFYMIKTIPTQVTQTTAQSSEPRPESADLDQPDSQKN
jgi:GNAT superfamily N-acetyltransferase